MNSTLDELLGYVTAHDWMDVIISWMIVIIKSTVWIYGGLCLIKYFHGF